VKIGDLVVYDRERVPASVPLKDFIRLGVVIRLSLYPAAYQPGDTATPTATIKWNGIDRPMNHRQDILAVLSENR
jgi:hypothetical protein